MKTSSLLMRCLRGMGKVVRHVRNGSLLERVRWEINRAQISSSKRKWRRLIAGRDHVDYSILKGVTMRLYHDSTLSPMIVAGGYEMNERLFIRRYLRPGDCFVDIGANIGLFSLEAAVVVGKAGKVYSFEPNPKTYDHLQENIRINNLVNMTALKCGVSSVHGTARLWVPADNFDAWSSFGKPTAGERFESEDVPVVTLDEFVQANQLAGCISMIKIDVEGWETAVLTGGLNCLAGSDAPLLQVEFTQQAALNANSSCAELFNQITSLGYTVCAYDHVKNRLDVVEKNLDWEYENLFATKNLERANQRLVIGRRYGR